eukprot:5038465-Prymnesium_polylepis.2
MNGWKKSCGCLVETTLHTSKQTRLSTIHSIPQTRPCTCGPPQLPPPPPPPPPLPPPSPTKTAIARVSQTRLHTKWPLMASSRCRRTNGVDCSTHTVESAAHTCMHSMWMSPLRMRNEPRRLRTTDRDSTSSPHSSRVDHPRSCRRQVMVAKPPIWLRER